MAAERIPRRLGRGLDALFQSFGAGDRDEAEGTLRQIPVTEIQSNPFQPRKDFNPGELAELRQSLSSSGLLQPITVRHQKAGIGYEVITGERRLRAATELGWTTITAMVKELDDRQLLGLALIENLQRADLNAVEEAEGYRRLVTEFGHTQQSVATMVGKDRSTITNMLRVLQLPITVREMLQTGQLTVGQARPLLALNNEPGMIELARETVRKSLTVREVERRVRESKVTKDGRKRARRDQPDTRTTEIRHLEDELRRYLQTDVSVSVGPNGRGMLAISFYSIEDLERIGDLIQSTRNPQ